MSADTFLASGVTALGLALIMLFLFINGKIVPGSMLDRANTMLEKKDDAINKLATVVEGLTQKTSRAIDELDKAKEGWRGRAG